MSAPHLASISPAVGENLLHFVALTPLGFKGRTFGPNPPLGARFYSGPGEKFLQWMELVPERFLLGGPLGFIVFVALSLGAY